MLHSRSDRPLKTKKKTAGFAPCSKTPTANRDGRTTTLSRALDFMFSLLHPVPGGVQDNQTMPEFAACQPAQRITIVERDTALIHATQSGPCMQNSTQDIALNHKPHDKHIGKNHCD